MDDHGTNDQIVTIFNSITTQSIPTDILDQLLTLTTPEVIFTIPQPTFELIWNDKIELISASVAALVSIQIPSGPDAIPTTPAILQFMLNILPHSQPCFDVGVDNVNVMNHHWAKLIQQLSTMLTFPTPTLSHPALSILALLTKTCPQQTRPAQAQLLFSQLQQCQVFANLLTFEANNTKDFKSYSDSIYPSFAQVAQAMFEEPRKPTQSQRSSPQPPRFHIEIKLLTRFKPTLSTLLIQTPNTEITTLQNLVQMLHVLSEYTARVEDPDDPIGPRFLASLITTKAFTKRLLGLLSSNGAADQDHDILAPVHATILRFIGNLLCLVEVPKVTTALLNENLIDKLLSFLNHRDVRCRQDAAWTLGNIAADIDISSQYLKKSTSCKAILDRFKIEQDAKTCTNIVYIINNLISTYDEDRRYFTTELTKHGLFEAVHARLLQCDNFHLVSNIIELVLYALFAKVRFGFERLNLMRDYSEVGDDENEGGENDDEDGYDDTMGDGDANDGRMERANLDKFNQANQSHQDIIQLNFPFRVSLADQKYFETTAKQDGRIGEKPEHYFAHLQTCDIFINKLLLAGNDNL